MSKKQSNPLPPVGVGFRPAPPPGPPTFDRPFRDALMPPEPPKKASELLAESAGPFDAACMMVREMEERMAMILRLLDEGFDPDALTYDMQAVNQAHRVAAGGMMPRETNLKYPMGEDDEETKQPDR